MVLFWINPPKEKIDKYLIDLNGFLISENYRRRKNCHEKISLGYDEIKKILMLESQKERYEECERIFIKRYPQIMWEDKKDISKKERSELENLILRDFKMRSKKWFYSTLNYLNIFKDLKSD